MDGEGRSRRLLPLAAAIAAIIVVVQAAVIAALLRPSPGLEDSAGRAAADAVVAFAPDAEMAEVSALLDLAGATFAGGPGTGGTYEIRLKTQPASRAEIAAAVKVLAGSALVKTAKPAAGG